MRKVKNKKNLDKRIAYIKQNLDKANLRLDEAYRGLNALSVLCFEDRLRTLLLMKDNVLTTLKQLNCFYNTFLGNDFCIKDYDTHKFCYLKDVLAELEIDREIKLKKYKKETDDSKKRKIKGDLIDIEIELTFLRKKILNEKV